MAVFHSYVYKKSRANDTVISYVGQLLGILSTRGFSYGHTVCPILLELRELDGWSMGLLGWFRRCSKTPAKKARKNKCPLGDLEFCLSFKTVPNGIYGNLGSKLLSMRIQMVYTAYQHYALAFCSRKISLGIVK